MIALLSLLSLKESLSTGIKQIIIDVTDLLMPIVTMVSAGMIIIGIVLFAARQEFYGIRLCLSGGIALVIVHLVVPLLLGFL